MRKVRFGVAIPWIAENSTQGTEFIQNITRYLESVDKVYESAWFADHLIPNTEPINLDVPECLTTISYLLPQHPNLKFGALVLCNNYRNPALVAKMSSTLQALSDGRFILGIGAGWHKEEYRQYGYKYPSGRTRVEQLEEAVQIIRMMWREDGVTFHGKHYSIEDAYCNPKPDPAPPIVIGGGGEKYTLNVVAKYADWWSVPPGYHVEKWTHKMNVLANHCDDVGRDFDEILRSAEWCVALAGSDEEALELAKSSPHSLGSYIIGSPESLVSQIGELIDVGVEYFQLYFTLFPNHEETQTFADEVISELS